MSDNSDLEDRVNELERGKLQKRIAELEAELGTKPNVKEEPTGRIPGQERWKATPITKRTRKQNWVYRLGELLFLLLPLFAFLFYFFKGGITLWNISSENIIGSSRDISLYILGGFVAYFIIMELIWRLIIRIFFGRMEGGTRKRGNRGVKPVNPAARSADAAAQSVNTAAQTTVPAAQPAGPAAQPASVKPIPKTAKIVRTCLVSMVLVGFGIFGVFQVGKILLPKIELSFLEFLNLPTPENGLPYGSGREAYQYWIGDIPNTYYRLNFLGERARQVTGKPYMVIKYNNITQEIIDLEFGLSEVTQVELAHEEGFVAAPVPTLNAESIEFYEKLGLKSPVVVLVDWNSPPVSGGPVKQINNGFQQFSFVWSTAGPGGIEVGDNWIFTYTSSIMTGGCTNIDTEFYLGSESEANAFKLRRIQ